MDNETGQLIAQLEARLTLCESALVVLLAALARSAPHELPVAKKALKLAGKMVLDNMADGAGAQADKRTAHTVNNFLDALNKPVKD